MRSVKNRVHAAIAALLLCIPVLTGCADSSSAPASQADSEPAVTETVTTAAETEPAAESEAPSDLLQYEITDPFQYTVGEPEISGDLEQRKNVFFDRDGLKIYGQLHLPEGEGPFPTVIIVSGQTASYDYYTDEAETFAENGIAALTFDCIGAVGRSQSSGEITDYSVLTEAKDLNAVLDSMGKLPKVDTGKLFLWGHSLGGLVSTYIGCSRPDDICGLMLAEPSFVYPDAARALCPDLSEVPDVVTDTRMFGSVVGKIFVTDMASLDIFSMMPDCDRDAEIYLGTVDCLGSGYHEYFERAVTLFPSAKIVDLEGADHYFQHEDGERLMEKSLAFVKAHLDTPE